MRKFLTSLLAFFILAALVFMPSNGSAQQPVRSVPKRDHPIKLLPINPRYFPASEYDYSKFDGMVIPEGTGPVCPPQNEIVGGGWDQGPVDYESKAVGCRMPALAKSFDASTTPLHYEAAPRNGVRASDTNQSAYKIWAVNSPDCRPTPYPCNDADEGINKLYFSLSARKPTMNSGSPSDILYAVRMHAGGRIDGSHIQCSSPNVVDPNLVLGAGWGATLSGTITGDMKLVYERWDEEECALQMVTNYTIPETLAVYARMYMYYNDGNTNSAQWQQQIWWNNAWTTVSTLWTTFEQIAWIEYGVEYDPLTNNNYGKANIPWNFVGNVSFKTDKLDYLGFTQDNYPFDSTFVNFTNWSNKYYYIVNYPLHSNNWTISPNDQGNMFAHIN